MTGLLDSATQLLVVGVDVGGTKTALVVTDGSDRLVGERTVWPCRA